MDTMTASQRATDHEAEAERLLGRAQDVAVEDAPGYIAHAQVHATLAISSRLAVLASAVRR